MINENPIQNLNIDMTGLLDHFGIYDLVLPHIVNINDPCTGKIYFAGSNIGIFLVATGLILSNSTNTSTDALGQYTPIWEGNTPEGPIEIKNRTGFRDGVYFNFGDPTSFTYTDLFYPITVTDATVQDNTTTSYTVKVHQENQLKAGDIVTLWKNNWIDIKKSENQQRSSKLAVATVLSKTDATEVVVQNVFITPYLTALLPASTNDILSISKVSDIDYEKIKLQELINLGIITDAHP